jgi:hypothetical protein
VPLDLQPERLAAVRPLFWRVRDAELLDSATLSADERRLVDEHPWVFDHDDEHVAVGAFAELLLATDPHRRALQREVYVASHLQGRDRLRDAVDALLQELNGRRERELLFHQGAFKHRGTAFHVYKTRSDGRVRVAWREAAPHRVEIREVWIDDHATYEREVERGAVLQDTTNLRWVKFGEG